MRRYSEFSSKVLASNAFEENILQHLLKDYTTQEKKKINQMKKETKKLEVEMNQKQLKLKNSVLYNQHHNNAANGNDLTHITTDIFCHANVNKKKMKRNENNNKLQINSVADNYFLPDLDVKHAYRENTLNQNVTNIKSTASFPNINHFIKDNIDKPRTPGMLQVERCVNSKLIDDEKKMKTITNSNKPLDMTSKDTIIHNEKLLKNHSKHENKDIHTKNNVKVTQFSLPPIQSN